jgi:pimeloyl-ACP methyl ester carboxylesterase
MAELNKQITLPDGRVLGYACFGEPGGRPLIYCHGFPATRLEASILDRDARQSGVSVIAPDRPGLGLSDFQPGRRILDWPEDVRNLADQLSVDRFSVMGVSGGCPYALACAHALSGRIIHTGIVAGLGPTWEGGLTRYMSAAARMGFFLARRAPLLFGVVYGGVARLIGSPAFPGSFFTSTKVTRADREVLARPEVSRTLIESAREALRPGPRGPVHDLSLLSRPWGFPLAGISTALTIWHGLEDGTVPWQMGEFLAGKIPGATFHRLPHEGHISLPVRQGARMLEILCPVQPEPEP